MNDPEATVREIDRAVGDLRASGIQVFTNVNGRPLDDPTAPIFQRMAVIGRPIWLHPTRTGSFADYATEDKSKFELWWTFGWPYETSVAMARLVFAGYFDRWPGLRIITHHMGGMIPYFAGRIGPGLDQLGARTDDEDLTVYLKRLQKRPYIKMFFADTALFGAPHAMECGLRFFGIDQVVFASDFPFDPKGTFNIRETIKDIDALPISAAERQQIYEGNARKLLRLREDAEAASTLRSLRMNPTFFETPAQFRAWLQTHHRTADELWVGYWKSTPAAPASHGRNR